MRLSITAAALTFLLVPSIASSHGGNDDVNAVHACINKSSKAVRIVGVSGSCSNSETAAHWPGDDSADSADAAGPCFDLTNRYVDCGNGTVTDSVTGLIWLQVVDCFTNVNWLAAQQSAAGLEDGECGLTDGSSPGDWRLPTRDEWLATVAGFNCNHPPLTNDAGTACHSAGPSSFVNNDDSWDRFLWLSTTVADDPTKAGVGSLGFSGVVYVTKDQPQATLPALLAWPVRGGPP